MGRLLRRKVFAVVAALAIATVTTTAPAFADVRDFELINNTGQTIQQVYVSPSKDDDWGDDILGNDVLPAGRRVNITFGRFAEAACYYDIKVITESGAEGRLDDVNLCEISTVTFHS
jgi:hypothetical protein